MIREKINPADVDYSNVAKHIPDVMNSLYNEDVIKLTHLHEIRDAFRIKQMQSKAWLMSGIVNYGLPSTSKILVIGSWIGFTSLVLFKNGFRYVTEVDPEKRLTELAKHVNRFNSDFLHITDDVNNIDVSRYDVIVNTSCEHILDNSWFEKIKSGATVFLHSNDLQGYDHINTCSSVDNMIEKYPLTLCYAGELNFVDWRRFMLIGKKS